MACNVPIPIKVLSNVFYTRAVNLVGNSLGIVRIVALGIVVTYHDFHCVSYTICQCLQARLQ